jgi:hypothetical protein
VLGTERAYIPGVGGGGGTAAAGDVRGSADIVCEDPVLALLGAHPDCSFVANTRAHNPANSCPPRACSAPLMRPTGKTRSRQAGKQTLDPAFWTCVFCVMLVSGLRSLHTLNSVKLAIVRTRHSTHCQFETG